MLQLTLKLSLQISTFNFIKLESTYHRKSDIRFITVSMKITKFRYLNWHTSSHRKSKISFWNSAGKHSLEKNAEVCTSFWENISKKRSRRNFRFWTIAAVCFCFSKRTAVVSAVPTSPIQDKFRWCFLGPLLFQLSEIERCSVQMSADCCCFSGPKSSVALCRCLRTAIVSAVRSRALLCADVCGLLLFQRSEVERCSV